MLQDGRSTDYYRLADHGMIDHRLQRLRLAETEPRRALTKLSPLPAPLQPAGRRWHLRDRRRPDRRATANLLMGWDLGAK